MLWSFIIFFYYISPETFQILALEVEPVLKLQSIGWLRTVKRRSHFNLILSVARMEGTFYIFTFLKRTNENVVGDDNKAFSRLINKSKYVEMKGFSSEQCHHQENGATTEVAGTGKAPK